MPANLAHVTDGPQVIVHDWMFNQGYDGVNNATRGRYYPQENQATGDGVTDDSGAFLATDTANGGKGVTVVAPAPNGYRLAAATTLAHALTLPFGALLKPDSGVTVQINGNLDAGPYQVFGGAGTVALGAGALAKGIRLEWFGADLTGATDCTAAWTNAIAALPANGGAIHIGQGTWQFGNVALPSEPKTVDIIGEGPGKTIFVPNAANTPLFVTPSVGVWSKGRMEGFSVKAHASGSTGAAIPLVNARTVVLKDIEYLSNGSGDFAAWFELGGGHCYGITIEHPIMQGQVGPAKIINFVNAGDSDTNCNIATIKNGWFYLNTGTGTIIDALRSASVTITDNEFEDNTNYVPIVPGTSTKSRGNWLEGNNGTYAPATVAGQGTTNACELGPDYHSSTGVTITFPSGCSNNVLNGNWPDTNVTMVDNDETNEKRVGLVRGTAAVDGIYPFKNAAAGANLWQLISAATGSSFSGAGALVLRNATAATRPLIIDGTAPDLALNLAAGAATFAKVVIMPQLAFTGGNRVSFGSGAPSAPGGNAPTVGDIYFRTDTTTTANQRLYICSGVGPTVWTGIA